MGLKADPMGNMVHDTGRTGLGPFEFSLGDELRGERATLGKTLLDIQRDLRIKAAYIAAIEDAKPEVFPNPSFIAGYVRSYARYLGMDPDEVFQRFCRESGFTGKAGAGVHAIAAPKKGATSKIGGGGFVSPIAALEGGLPPIPFAAIGSLVVMVGLIAGLGYGGWTVLQNIQRVQFAPVEELPVAVAEMDPLAVPDTAQLAEPGYTDLAEPVTATALAELYRQQELEVPIIAPRDGPIAALDPDAVGLLARPSASADALAAAAEVPAALVDSPVIADLVAAAVASDTAPAPVTIVAERAAWIRVYLANGTVLFESILEKGQSYTPPEGTDAPMIWAGNSGSVYAKIGDTLYGPLGSGTRAAKDVSLAPPAIIEKFSVVTEIPEVISQSIGVAPANAQPPVAIQ
jgi:cytoskeletal protein RodZ